MFTIGYFLGFQKLEGFFVCVFLLLYVDRNARLKLVILSLFFHWLWYFQWNFQVILRGRGDRDLIPALSHPGAWRQSGFREVGGASSALSESYRASASGRDAAPHPALVEASAYERWWAAGCPPGVPGSGPQNNADLVSMEKNLGLWWI